MYYVLVLFPITFSDLEMSNDDCHERNFDCNDPKAFNSQKAKLDSLSRQLNLVNKEMEPCKYGPYSMKLSAAVKPGILLISHLKGLI